jgi:hypothetical protein
MGRPQAGTRDRPTPTSGLLHPPGSSSFCWLGYVTEPSYPASEALGFDRGLLFFGLNRRFSRVPSKKEGPQMPIQRDSEGRWGLRS